LLDGVASVGTRPTVDGVEPLLEVHIFDFDRDIYGQYIQVDFVAKLREEERFPDLKSMQDQMHVDAAQARDILTAA
jgi:riboflavin kinase/FMN adenylyltransferase